MRLCTILLVTIVTSTAASATCASPSTSDPASQAELDRYRERRGALISAETTFAGMRGRYAAYRVRLTSDGGLVATGRLLQPARASGSHRYPAVLLNDGRELDSRAIDYLPEEFGDVVVLSLDYPASLPYEIDLTDVVLRGERLRDAAEQIPALFSLGGSYLVTRSDVEPARLAIAATSFAVPFAVIAAAVDDRFRNVALIYGAGDFDRVLAANLTVRPRFLRGPLAWLAMRPFRALEPERYVAHIAPRPLIMINGIDDPQMPRAAVEALYAAAREPRALVWLRTGHLAPGDSMLIRRLVDTALARLPVLQGVDTDGNAFRGSACPAPAISSRAASDTWRRRRERYQAGRSDPAEDLMGSKPSNNFQSNRPESGGANHDEKLEKSGILGVTGSGLVMRHRITATLPGAVREASEIP